MRRMPSRRRGVLPGMLLLPAALALACASLAGSWSGDARLGRQGTTGAGEDRVMVVTTDSTAYCRELSAAIDRHGALPREVSDLEARGQGLCKRGKVRGGVLRLRRALRMLDGSPATEPAR